MTSGDSWGKTRAAKGFGAVRERDRQVHSPGRPLAACLLLPGEAILRRDSRGLRSCRAEQSEGREAGSLATGGDGCRMLRMLSGHLLMPKGPVKCAGTPEPSSLLG